MQYTQEKCSAGVMNYTNAFFTIMSEEKSAIISYNQLQSITLLLSPYLADWSSNEVECDNREFNHVKNYHYRWSTGG